MIQLYFNPQKFSRNMKHKEWKSIWRWKRITEKKLAEEMRRQCNNISVYGTTHPELLDRIVNPAILMHDQQH